MPKLSILHASDLHISANNNRQPFGYFPTHLQAFVNFARDRAREYQFLYLTGDHAETGDLADLQTAHDVLFGQVQRNTGKNGAPRASADTTQGLGGRHS